MLVTVSMSVHCQFFSVGLPLALESVRENNCSIIALIHFVTSQFRTEPNPKTYPRHDRLAQPQISTEVHKGAYGAANP